MPVNLLSNVDVIAVSLVNKGANRKRFFLRKAADEEKSELLTLPAQSHGLLKAEDWSAVYCVVAEPGALEDSGMGGTDTADRWASEDEIRKACHRFAKNGGLINQMHETLDPYGAMVENAVALADFVVDGETIRKGSWYIAIEPNEHGRDQIEKGEFTGVSIEGTGLRTLVEKADVLPVAAGSARSENEFVSSDVEQNENRNEEPVTVLAKIRNLLGITPTETVEVEKTVEGSTDETRTTDGEMETEEITQKFDGLEEKVDNLTKSLDALVTNLGAKSEDGEVSPESVAKAVEGLAGLEGEELTKRLDSIESDLKKLGAGSSAQNDEPDAEVADKAAIAKAYEDQGVDPVLKGLI